MKARDIQESEAFNIIDAGADYEMSPDDMMLDSMPVTREQITDAAKMVGEMALDMTPIVGDIKGAVELPEDMAAARQLIEQGYDEGDLMQMGLGGALGALSVAGLIPMAGAVADIAKAPVKAAARSSLADQTEAALSQAEKNVRDKGILTKNQGTSFRGRVVPEGQLRTATFSGEEKARPKPKVFHGAGSMQKGSKADLAEGIEDLRDMQHTYIKEKSSVMFDLLRDKSIGTDPNIAYKNPDAKLNMQDVLEFQETKPYDMIEIPVLRGPREPIDVLTVKIERDSDNKKLYRVFEFDTDKGEKKDVVGFISPDTNDTITKADLEFTFRSISDAQSKISDIQPTRTRREKIRDEGFQPFTEFKGEEGLDKHASGVHAELKDYMLSTSRDPLVAMKPGFGGRDTRNIVYSDLPEDQAVDMTPKAYNTVSAYGDRDYLPKRGERQIGYKLPKSLHLEAEIAITNPELLNPKLLSENPKLADKIQRGQDIVDSLVGPDDAVDAANLKFGSGEVDNPTFNAKYNYNTVRGMDRMKAETVYKDTRKALNDLQSLGQFTEQYGARGTYDDVLETLVDGKLVDNLLKAAGEFPEESIKGNHLYGLAAVVDTMKQNLKGAGYNAAQRDAMKTRGISDEVLYDAIYKGKVKDDATRKKLEEAGIEISGDGDPNISRYDVGYNDLKRLMFLGTEKMNRGGLAARK